MATGAIPTFEEFKAQQGGRIPSFEEFKATRQDVNTEAPAGFYQTLKKNLGPSAQGVVASTASAYKNMGPQSGTLAPRDERIPEDSPFYGFRKTLLDLEDTAKSLYAKVADPASTFANDPVGVVAEIGKLVSSIRVARDMAQGKPAPTFTETSVGRVASDAATKAKELAVPVIKGTAAAAANVPAFPRTFGAYTRPFKSGAKAFNAARDAQAAEEVAALPSVPAVPPPLPNPAASIDYSSLPGVGPRPSTAAAVAATPELDTIAQSLGAKDYASTAGDLALRKVIDGISKAPKAAVTLAPPRAAPQPIAPNAPVDVGPPQAPGHTIQEQLQAHLDAQRAQAPPPEPSGPVTPENLTERLNQLLREARIKSGGDPDVPLGKVKGAHYMNRFAGEDSPVIDSSKRRVESTAEIANPSKILTKKAFRDSLPADSPLRSGNRFEKAYKIAVEWRANMIAK